MPVQDIIEKATEVAIGRSKEQIADAFKKIKENNLVEKLLENADFTAPRMTVDDFLPPATVLSDNQIEQVAKFASKIQENLEDLYRVAYRDGFKAGRERGQEAVAEKTKQGYLEQLEVELSTRYGKKVKICPVIVFDPETFKAHRPVNYGDVKLKIADETGGEITSREKVNYLRDLICQTIDNARI